MNMSKENGNSMEASHEQLLSLSFSAPFGMRFAFRQKVNSDKLFAMSEVVNVSKVVKNHGNVVKAWRSGGKRRGSGRADLGSGEFTTYFTTLHPFYNFSTNSQKL